MFTPREIAEVCKRALSFPRCDPRARGSQKLLLYRKLAESDLIAGNRKRNNVGDKKCRRGYIRARCTCAFKCAYRYSGYS